MKPKLFHKKDLTLKDLIDITRNCSEDAIILNSCYTPEYTLENINRLELFDHILGFYDEITSICAEFLLGDKPSKYEAMKLKTLISKNLNKTLPIDRDVDDGFRYENYSNIVYTENIIILC